MLSIKLKILTLLKTTEPLEAFLVYDERHGVFVKCHRRLEFEPDEGEEDLVPWDVAEFTPASLDYECDESLEVDNYDPAVALVPENASMADILAIASALLDGDCIDAAEAHCFYTPLFVQYRNSDRVATFESYAEEL